MTSPKVKGDGPGAQPKGVVALRQEEGRGPSTGFSGFQAERKWKWVGTDGELEALKHRVSVKCKVGMRPEQQVGGPEVEQLLEEAARGGHR